MKRFKVDVLKSSMWCDVAWLYLYEIEIEQVDSCSSILHILRNNDDDQEIYLLVDCTNECVFLAAVDDSNIYKFELHVTEEEKEYIDRIIEHL